MTALVRVLAICLVCVLPCHATHPALRCLADLRSAKSALRQSAAVFLGEVLEIKSGGNFLEARFRVERFWKGVATEEVSVSVDSTTESPHYRVGEKYLVFAGLKERKLFTGTCSRTKKLEYAQGDLQQLGEGQKVKTRGSTKSPGLVRLSVFRIDF